MLYLFKITEEEKIYDLKGQIMIFQFSTEPWWPEINNLKSKVIEKEKFLDYLKENDKRKKLSLDKESNRLKRSLKRKCGELFNAFWWKKKNKEVEKLSYELDFKEYKIPTKASLFKWVSVTWKFAKTIDLLKKGLIRKS